MQELFGEAARLRGHTFYELAGFDADRVSGWSAIVMYDAFTENAWDLKRDFATGTAFTTKAKALNARPFRLRPLLAVHDCCSTGGGADGVMYLFMASPARARVGLIGCCRQAAVGAKSIGAQRCGSSRFIRRGKPWTS